jgi:hypothetical protein
VLIANTVIRQNRIVFSVVKPSANADFRQSGDSDDEADAHAMATLLAMRSIGGHRLRRRGAFHKSFVGA